MPSTTFPENLIVMVETYDVYPDLKLCLELGGKVYICNDPVTLERDNRRRKELGLQEP